MAYSLIVVPVLPVIQFPLDKVSTCHPLRTRAVCQYSPLTPMLES